MSSRELIESLRRTAGEKVRLMKEEAEHEADATRKALEREVEDLQARYAERLAAEAREDGRRARAEAAIRARTLKLAAERRLADRLLSLSRAALGMMRGSGNHAVFEKLVKELPDLSWSRVMVHPGDRDQARRLFPGADILPLDTISGGIEAATEDGAIRVVNTFEKRLERAWEDILPLLMADIYREAGDGASAKPL